MNNGYQSCRVSFGIAPNLDIGTIGDEPIQISILNEIGYDDEKKKLIPICKAKQPKLSIQANY